MFVGRAITGLSILALTCAAATCSRASQPQACTLIGCNSGLAVQIADVPSESYTVSVQVPGNAASARVVECGSDRRCGGSVFFADFTAELVEVQITAEGESRTEIFRPDYESVRPNGPGCPPVCRQGTVDFHW